MVNVLAVDPGTTTGYVRFVPKHKLQIRGIDWGEVAGPVEFGRLVGKWLRVYPMEVSYAVVEDFVPYYDGRRRTWEPDALHVIGMMRYLFTDQSCYLGQVAADAHAWGTDGKIAPYRQDPPGVGKGGEGHALMALRHALLWTATRWDGIS